MNPKVNIYRAGQLICTTEGVLGESLHNRIIASGIFLDAPCGGNGRCGKCKVRLSPDGEEVLACRTYIEGDIDVYLPDTMKMKIMESGGKQAENVHVQPDARLGVAVDIGTTTVVAHLLDLQTGERLATVSDVNAQRRFGADVISRIQYSMENGHSSLTNLIRSQIAGFITDLCRKTGAVRENIHFLSIAGNTVMEHYFANLSPNGMGTAPFTPESLFGTVHPAESDLGMADNAQVYEARCVASYVGGDITAGMLAAGLPEAKGNILFLDIGTNGEMAMKAKNKYYCCATAAGPAFEGAEIEMGMAAIDGAVNHVHWSGTELQIDVIGDTKPIGLCGSGLIDALAVLVVTGAVDETGRLLDRNEMDGPISAHLGQKDGKNVFWLDDAHTVCMTAEDIRKLQLAKAAIAAGIETLMHHSGQTEIDAFLIAGGFGSYMDRDSAADIGLFPKRFLPVSKAVGNTAGEGAVLALLSPQARETIDAICQDCEYIELSDSAFFNEAFIEHIMFDNEEVN
jgi:uncharacterized 2Fe-2S/4Fe-4S cluster protein (DUF4445 family)